MGANLPAKWPSSKNLKIITHTHTKEIFLKKERKKKPTNNKCWRWCREKKTLLNCWWKCKLVQPQRRTVWRCLKKLKRGTFLMVQVKNLPANAGDTGLIPGPRRYYMLRRAVRR